MKPSSPPRGLKVFGYFTSTSTTHIAILEALGCPMATSPRFFDLRIILMASVYGVKPNDLTVLHLTGKCMAVLTTQGTPSLRGQHGNAGFRLLCAICVLHVVIPMAIQPHTVRLVINRFVLIKKVFKMIVTR